MKKQALRLMLIVNAVTGILIAGVVSAIRHAKLELIILMLVLLLILAIVTIILYRILTKPEPKTIEQENNDAAGH